MMSSYNAITLPTVTHTMPIQCMYYVSTMSIPLHTNTMQCIQDSYLYNAYTMQVLCQYYVSTYWLNCHIMILQLVMAGFYFVFISKATVFSFWVIYTNVTGQRKIFDTSQCFFIWVLCKRTQMLYYPYTMLILCKDNSHTMPIQVYPIRTDQLYIRCSYNARTIHI